ncbi:neuropeptide CCHamide-2 receptor isoform X3 [Plutella xylostella]|uniref:neuropeptide CCHamide-2 receptor isoform X3 n=1 Tax=Plutella xylostella TaxID=51655 RepID=UPI002032FBD2|nr:neuropeptide CCHamide-2 receptor isoform X3 [Plutella xylostella]
MSLLPVNASSLLDDNLTDSEYTPYEDRLETYLVPVLFAIIFVVGVLGNGTLVIVYVRHRGMRNAPNTYIFSLALADLLVILICVPFVSVIYTLESWPWGELICRISEAAKDVSIGVSVFTLTALSAERYCAIVNPFRKLQLRKLPLVCATVIWAAALLFAVPAALFSSTPTVLLQDNITIYYCTPYPKGWKNYTKWMTLSKAVIYYALPLLVISIFYSLMARRLLASTKEMPGALHAGQGEAQAKARKSVACMVLIFVIVFFVCFLPYHTFEVWFYFSPTAENDYNDWTHAWRIIAFCLSFLNSCVNPVALYCVSGVFRQLFNRYLCCRRGALHPTCSSRMSRTAVCETSFRSTHRHRCNRNPTESVVISNYDYGSTKKKSNIISRNSTDGVSGVTIMTIRDTSEFINGDADEKCVNR